MTRVFILLFTIVMAVYAVMYRPIGDGSTESDFYGVMVPNARALHHGVIPLDGYRGPFYPVLLALAELPVGDYFLAGKLLSVLAAGVALWLAHKLFTRFGILGYWNLAAVALVALNPNFAKFSYSAGTDMVWTALIWLGFYLLLMPDRLTLVRGLAAGLVFVLGYLTRTNGIPFLIFFAAWLLFVPRSEDGKRDFKPLTGYLLVVVLLIGCWTWLQFKSTGSIFYNQNHLNIAYEAYAPDGQTGDAFLAKEAYKYPNLTSVLLANPVKLGWTALKNFFDHFLHDLGLLPTTTVSGFYPYALNVMMTPLIGLLTLLGLIVGGWRERSVRVLLLAGLAYTLTMTLVLYAPRYNMVMLIVYLPLAWYALRTTWLMRSLADRPLTVWVTSAAVLLSAGLMIHAVKFDRRMMTTRYLPLVRQLRQHRIDIPPGSRIAAHKPHVAYVLDGEPVVLPYFHTLPELLLYLNRERVDFLFFGDWEAHANPEMLPLARNVTEIADLKPVIASIQPLMTIYKCRQTLDELVLSRYDYGNVPLGRDSTAYIPLANTTPEEISIDSLVCNRNDFILPALPAKPVIPARQTIGMPLRFHPVEPGVKTDTIWIYHTSPASPSLVIVTGRGV